MTKPLVGFGKMNTLSRLEAIREVRHIIRQERGEVYLGDDDTIGTITFNYQSKQLEHSYRVPDVFIIPNEYGEIEETWEHKPLKTKEVMALIKRYFDRTPLVYVNAYAVDRVHVSHAEGGIWEDQGTPLTSVPVLKKKDNVDRVVEILTEALGPEYEQEHGRTRFSVLGRADLAVYVESHPAERWPRGGRPYVYE